jgi:very-short-patch-repair endonuclease
VANSTDDTQTQSDGVASTATKASIPFRNAKNYFSLPYNPNLKKRARLLRKAGNLSEVLFWNRVKNKQFKGFDFDRQKVIGNYIVDFYCTNTNVVVEIDGSSHDNKQEYDRERDEYLQSLGLTVIHIPVKDVMKNIEGVMQMLYNHPAMKQPAVTHAEEKPPLTPPKEGNGKEEGKVRRLVKEKAAIEFSIEELEYIDQLLDNVKICDPAIGSGAFPMGLLHEILSLKELIAYETGKAWNPAEAKLNIIQNSIYGVDIEKGAVDIARLRFWLSLVIDEEKPKPLPNLDYKIVVGDSLISRFDGEIIEIDWERRQSVGKADQYVKNVQKFLKEVSEMQKQYFSPDNADKEKIRNDIRRLKIELLINQLSFNKELYLNKTAARGGFLPSAADIKYNTERELEIKRFDNLIDKLNSLLKHPDEPFHHFDWKLDFPEVLNPYLVPDENRRGFDIVIGNPPYITFKGKEKVNISDIDVKYLLDVYKNSAEYKINSYALFIEKGLTICKNNGLLSYIIPSTILQNEYLKKIRELLVTKNHIKQIVTFGNKVFNAVTDSIVLFVSKSMKEDAECISIRKSDLDFNYLNEVKRFKQQIWNDSNKDFVINLKTKYEEDRIIKIIENNSFYIEDFLEVYVGIVANGIKKFLSTSMINSNYKKYLQGKHIDNFQIKPEKLFINFAKDELHSNTDENVYLQKEKILVRKTGNQLIAVIDNKQYFTDQSIYNLYPKKGISVNLKLVTGLLNLYLL